MAVIMSYHGNLESRAALVEAVNLAKRLDENCCAYMSQKHRGDDLAVDSQVMEVLHDALGQEDLDYAVQPCPRGKDCKASFVLEVDPRKPRLLRGDWFGSPLTLRRYEYRS